MMTMGYYIRALLEMNQFILIISMFEISQLNGSSSLRILSLIFAFLMIIMCIIVIGVSMILALSSYQVEESKHYKLGEFLSGLKMQKRFKIYTSIILIRRIFYVFLLVVLISAPSKATIGILVFFQLIFTVYRAIFKSFEELKVDVIEIMNEAYYLILLSLLIFFNSESNWSSATTDIYMWIIASNSIMVCLIVLGNAIVIVISKFCNRRKNSITVEKIPVQSSQDMIGTFQKQKQSKEETKIDIKDKTIRKLNSIDEESKEQAIHELSVDNMKRDKNLYFENIGN